MSPVARLVSTIALLAGAVVLNGRYRAAINAIARLYTTETSLAYRLSSPDNLNKWMDARGADAFVLWRLGADLCILAAIAVACGVFA